MADISRYLPFAASTTPRQAATYLLGISLFSISFLVFLNSSVSFVITDLIGQKDGVGDVVGTLGFVDEVVALVACPAWGLVSDRLGVRWVAVIGYAVICLALVLFVQAGNVYPQLLLARICFAVGATAAATMVTAILPSLTDEDTHLGSALAHKSPESRASRNSIALSLESELTITPERYTRTLSSSASMNDVEEEKRLGKPSALAGYVGLFTGCGALLALALFLPLPARFGEVDGVTPGQAVEYSFYVVAAVAACVAVFVFWGLRGLKGEDGKGWSVLFGSKRMAAPEGTSEEEGEHARPVQDAEVIPYSHLLRDSIKLGFTDSHIAIGYLGGFVARASTVAISLFIPLFVNTFFISNGFCQGSPNDPSPELKKECRAAYILASILTGVAQLLGLICAPVFGYLSSKTGRGSLPVSVAALLGIVGYMVFPRLQSPEITDVDGRGGSPAVFLVVGMIGVSQIGAIVCSLGSLGRGVLMSDAVKEYQVVEGDEEEVEERSPETSESEQPSETTVLLPGETRLDSTSRVRLKGSIAGVYSWCGGAAILLLTKLGGYLFDSLSTGAPFYMMAIFNGILLAASVGIDMARVYGKKQ